MNLGKSPTQKHPLRHTRDNAEHSHHLLDPPLHSHTSSTLDDIFQNLKAQRREIESWKSQHRLSFTNPCPPPHIGATEEDGLTSQDLRQEIERLKKALKRYQQADPQVDFIHKDILEAKQAALCVLEEEKAAILQERDQILQDLKTVKWHNSNLVTQRDRALVDIEEGNKKQLELLDKLKQRQKLCMELRQSRDSFQSQLEEFSRRHKVLDSHLMEIGEQKTSFLEGIHERQSQLDFALAELQDLKKTLHIQKVQHEKLFQEKQDLDVYVEHLVNQLKQTETNLQEKETAFLALNSYLHQTEKKLDSSSAELQVSSVQVKRLTQDTRKKQQLLIKFSDGFESLLKRFETFIHEVEQEEASKILCIRDLTSVLHFLDESWDAVEQRKRDIPEQTSIAPNPIHILLDESERESLMEQINSLAHEIESLNEEKTTLKQQLCEQETVHEQYLKQIQRLQDDRQSLEKKINALEDKNRELVEDKKVLTDNERTLRKESEQLRSQIANLEQELTTQKTNVQDLERNLIKQSQLNQMLNSRLHLTEVKFGQRRSAIGWQEYGHNNNNNAITVLEKGITACVVYHEKKIPKVQLFHRENTVVQSLFIQLDPQGGTLRFFKTNKVQEGSKPEKILVLKDVLYTEYGYTSTSKQWGERTEKNNISIQSDGQPMYWRIFVIHSLEQVVDILCITDSDLKALVLGVARYAKDALTIRSQRELLYRRVKIKLLEHCRRRDITLVQLFLEAIRRSLALTPQLAQTLAVSVSKKNENNPKKTSELTFAKRSVIQKGSQPSLKTKTPNAKKVIPPKRKDVPLKKKHSAS